VGDQSSSSSMGQQLSKRKRRKKSSTKRRASQIQRPIVENQPKPPQEEASVFSMDDVDVSAKFIDQKLTVAKSVFQRFFFKCFDQVNLYGYA